MVYLCQLCSSRGCVCSNLVYLFYINVFTQSLKPMRLAADHCKKGQTNVLSMCFYGYSIRRCPFYRLTLDVSMRIRISLGLA